MVRNNKIVVVIPSYRVEDHLAEVIRSIPDFIDFIIVIDDKCPDHSGQIAQGLRLNDKRICVIFHDENQGVGGAVISGYKKAIELGADIVVKVDGDGQMDCARIKRLITPIMDNSADYTKGNRFFNFGALRSMPVIRLFGNSGLSFLVKISSGYWNIMDPTNGFTAINSKALNSLNLDNISKRYFFESDMLINLNIAGNVVKDIPIPAKYGDERSSMRVSSILVEFPFKLFAGFVKRIFLKYYIYDFNMGSVYMLLGFPMVIWGIGFGFYRWGIAVNYNIINSTGTVMLAVLPLILGTQFLLAAINIDINSTPKKES